MRWAVCKKGGASLVYAPPIRAEFDFRDKSPEQLIVSFWTPDNARTVKHLRLAG